MTIDEFLEAFPEFAPTYAQNPDQVAAALTTVGRYVSDSWGESRDEIIGLECAARLAASPVGRAAQLSGEDGGSTYTRELNRRKRMHACSELRIA
jgi:hypothetical protein